MLSYSSLQQLKSQLKLGLSPAYFLSLRVSAFPAWPPGVFELLCGVPSDKQRLLEKLQPAAIWADQ